MLKSSQFNQEENYQELQNVHAMRVRGLKSLSAVDDFFDQWYPSTATLMEEVFRL